VWLDEWQLMDEITGEDVGIPMLLDHNGDAVFVYTPPSMAVFRPFPALVEICGPSLAVGGFRYTKGRRLGHQTFSRSEVVYFCSAPLV